MISGYRRFGGNSFLHFQRGSQPENAGVMFPPFSDTHPTISRISQSKGPQYEGNILKKLLPNDECIIVCEEKQKNCQFVVSCSMVLCCKTVRMHQLIGGLHWRIRMRIVVYGIPSLAERVTFLRNTDLDIQVFCGKLYRVIHKSLRDFRTGLRNNQDRHGRKEHINR